MEAPPISVILCANRLRDRAEMEEALVHELVHVYDVSRPHTSEVLSYLRHKKHLSLIRNHAGNVLFRSMRWRGGI